MRSRRTVRRESRSARASAPRYGARVAAAATRPRYRGILQVTTPSNISLSEPDEAARPRAAAAGWPGRPHHRYHGSGASWRPPARGEPQGVRSPGRPPSAFVCAVPQKPSRASRAARRPSLLRRVGQQIVEPRRHGVTRHGVAAPRVQVRPLPHHTLFVTASQTFLEVVTRRHAAGSCSSQILRFVIRSTGAPPGPCPRWYRSVGQPPAPGFCSVPSRLCVAALPQIHVAEDDARVVLVMLHGRTPSRSLLDSSASARR